MKEKLPVFEFDKYDESKLKPEDKYLFYSNYETNLLTYKTYCPFKYIWHVLRGRKEDIRMGRINT